MLVYKTKLTSKFKALSVIVTEAPYISSLFFAQVLNQLRKKQRNKTYERPDYHLTIDKADTR